MVRFGSFDDHVLFTMQFMQMCDDFAVFIKEDECPSCNLQTRSNAICLNDECNWMLFVSTGKLHPATLPWIEEIKNRVQRGSID